MNSKKAITLLVLVTLMMTLAPLVPVHAITLNDLTNPNVKKGDKITVTGGGVTAGATVNIYWDNAMKETFSDGSGKIGSGTAGANGQYSIEVTVPEGKAGTHYIWVKDVSTGQTAGGANGMVTVIPKLTVSPSSGLKNDKPTLTGYGFGSEVNVAITFKDSPTQGIPLAVNATTQPKTNKLGTFTYVFTITADDYADDYPIFANDTVNADDIVFKVGPAITLDIKEGPVGSVVTITGRGFEYPGTVTVVLEGIFTCKITSGAAVRSDGKIVTKAVIPSAPEGDWTITVYDDDVPSNSATADFTVNGVAKVKATPSYGPQGGSLVVEGWNFTKILNTNVVVTIGGIQPKTFKTDASGYFKGTYTIPAVASGDPELKAEQADYYIVANSTVRVGVMLVIITPSSGPSGAKVSISGVGFTADEPFTIYAGPLEWGTGIVAFDGTIFAVLNVVTLDPGTYTIKVVDEETDIEVITTFTVTERTMLELDPVKAPRSTAIDFPVTVEGWYFAEDPVDPSLSFVLYNATNQWSLVVEYGGLAVTLGADPDWDPGYFMGVFNVPKENEIDLGVYTLNVTDGAGLHAQILFELVSKEVAISPRKATFRIGETVSFNVESHFQQPNSYIKIWDPSNNLYWTTDPFASGLWISVGVMKVYPFYEQRAGGNPMVLLDDAPLGTYKWTWYASDNSVIDQGTFTVAASLEGVLGQQIEDLNQAVTDLQTDISTVSSEMAGVRTQITNAINAANAAVQAANAATQAVNAVAQTASAASTAATNAANAATEAKNAANGLTTLVYGAIGASLVAALAAIVSLMQISKRIAG